MTTDDSSPETIWPTVLFELALGGLAIGVAYAAGFWNPPQWQTLGMPYHATSWPAVVAAVGWGALATLPLFVLLWVTSLLPIPGIKELNKLVDDALLPMFANQPVLMLLAASLAAGIGEELLFRWTIQTGFAEGLKSPAAWFVGLAIGAAVFGLMHWLTPTYAILATIIGVYLGLELLWTQSLVAVITTHALYDFVVLVYLTRRSRPRPRDASPSSAVNESQDVTS